jgi:hypothetical protein
MTRLGIIAFASIILAAVPAMGADDANSLIAQGLELRRQGKPAEALQLFERAHALAPSARTFGQMGLAETALQRWVDAESHLLASLSVADDSWAKKNRGFLEQALVLAKSHIGELMVTGPEATEVSVDGKVVGTLPIVRPTRLAEGVVRVTANSSGLKAFSKSVSIQAGARTQLAIVLEPVETKPAVALSRPVPIPAPLPPPPAPAPPAAPGADSGGAGWRTWTGAGIATAGVGLLTWGVVWIAVDGDDHCSFAGGYTCTVVYDTGKIGWILAGAGAAVTATGAVLLLTGGRKNERDVAVGLTPSSFLVRARF